VSRVPKILIVVSEIPGIARDRGGQGWRKSPRPSWDEMDSSTKTSAMEMRLCLDVYERAAEDSLGALTEQRKPRELGESRSHDNQKNRTRTSGLDGVSAPSGVISKWTGPVAERWSGIGMQGELDRQGSSGRIA